MTKGIPPETRYGPFLLTTMRLIEEDVFMIIRFAIFRYWSPLSFPNLPEWGSEVLRQFQFCSLQNEPRRKLVLVIFITLCVMLWRDWNFKLIARNER